jgi:pyruvate dehydrogenase E1 component alpha subunit
MTYRHRGHSVADAGLSYRSQEEIEEHCRHDPIDRAADALVERGALRREELDELREGAERQVREAVEFAEASPEPDVASLAEHLYGDETWAQQHERMRSGGPFGEAELLGAEAART